MALPRCHVPRLHLRGAAVSGEQCCTRIAGRHHFEIQILCLIIAAGLIAAMINLNSKYFVLALSRDYSLIRPSR